VFVVRHGPPHCAPRPRRIHTPAHSTAMRAMAGKWSRETWLSTASSLRAVRAPRIALPPALLLLTTARLAHAGASVAAARSRAPPLAAPERTGSPVTPSRPPQKITATRERHGAQARTSQQQYCNTPTSGRANGLQSPSAVTTPAPANIRAACRHTRTARSRQARGRGAVFSTASMTRRHTRACMPNASGGTALACLHETRAAGSTRAAHAVRRIPFAHLPCDAKMPP
jgi:hypothetical protein